MLQLRQPPSFAGQHKRPQFDPVIMNNDAHLAAKGFTKSQPSTEADSRQGPVVDNPSSS